MAAAERLFSLELLVDWVRLEPELPPRAPAVAFRLLDFPPLLVLPPAAPRTEPRRGSIGFGRGKACLLRLRPAALRRPRLRAALLQPPGDPPRAPAPSAHRPLRLLGTCDVPLEGAAGRGTFVVRGPTGERVGDVALFYRLTDLGRCAPRAAQLPASEPDPQPARSPAPQSPGEVDVVVSTRTCAGDAGGDAGGDAEVAASQRSGSDSPPGSPEQDWDANTFCPPPLYYTHPSPGKTPPARAEITIQPLGDGPHDADTARGTSPPRPPERPRCTPGDPPHPREAGTGPGAACPPLADHSTVDTIRQLPLLNALLVELSLLHSRPVASPTRVHPHLAWLYRADPGAPQSSTTSTSMSQADSKKKSAGGEPGESLPRAKNAAENPQEDKRVRGSPPRRAPRGRLWYGLTNTLRLRLRQTNPDELRAHEKREQLRKMQLSTSGRKPGVPRRVACPGGTGSRAENSDASKQIGGSLDDPRTPAEPPPNCAPGSPQDAGVSPAHAILPGRSPRGKIWGGKLETQAPSPCASQRGVVGEAGAGQDGTPGGDSSVAERSGNSYSDDFASSCYSQDFSGEDSIACADQKHSSRASESSEESRVPSPPFSAGSPVLSRRMSRDRSTSAGEDSSSLWMNQTEQTTTHQAQGVPSKKPGVRGKASEKSQSPRTSQVSSYLPSNLSELELKALDNSLSGHSEEDNDDLGSLRISKQCKDICELVINKLPGYTV